MNSRLAAYEVLVMLADSSPSNLQIITKELLSMHHQPDPALTKEFDVRFLDLGVLNFFKSVLLNIELLKLYFHFSNHKASQYYAFIYHVYILKSTIIYDVLLNGTLLVN